MCNWTIGTYEAWLNFSMIIDEMKQGEFMRMDETTVQVLHEEGPASRIEIVYVGRHWLSRAG